MAGQMYFGTKGNMKMVRCPVIGMDMGKTRWGIDGVFLNGGGYEKHSATGHKRYAMSWEMISIAEANAIEDYFDGLYGDPPFYFLDPFALAGNILPQYWAAPYLAAIGAPSLTGGSPTATATAANTLGYPTRSATYASYAAGGTSLYIPVPPGSNFYFGWHGSGTGTITLTPDSGSVVTASTPLAVTSTTRTNAVLTNPGGVTLSLTAATSMVISGMFGYIGTAAPVLGGFLSGQGHSGCGIVVGDTVRTGYSAPQALDKVSLGTTLVEVGAWL